MGLLSAYLFIAVNSTWLWILVLVVALYWAYMRMFIAYYDTNIERTEGKTFIITGAETGIGRMTADLMASRGGHLIMACKDVHLGQIARDQIVARTNNNKVEVRHLDLSSLDSVRKFSKDFHDSVGKLDVLINNAAIACSPNPTTADGLNTIMQVNHFGPFLLTNLLLDLLKKSSPSRVVFVSSLFHHFHKFSMDNLNCDKQRLPNCRVYFNSKLANILTAKYFARMLQGTGVTVNTVHPGMALTDMTKKCSGSFIGILCNLWLNVFGKTPCEAAMTPAYAATEIKLAYVTGEHFADCKVSHCVANIAHNTNLQDKLFEKSAELVHLKSAEKHF
ncbi:retinol dehydrogenase 12-like [Homalodisca vitripennis]|uniref:retinol dehydrogenase 12-like n=1 Tax=Homalodisca vitripennis TaxID=197043 RepID=UPI001EEBA7E4|nr:retinol dehydrogenase 12-like [Homalodisca vitripennis]